MPGSLSPATLQTAEGINIEGINTQGLDVLMPTQHRALLWDPHTFIRLSEHNGRQGKGQRRDFYYYY